MVERTRHNSSKNQFKEKLVQLYERFFTGVDISEGNEEFWDDFFLLKVNIRYLVLQFRKLTLDEILCLKPQLQMLMEHSMDVAASSKHAIRVANALQTVDCFIHGVLTCPRSSARPPDLLALFFKSEEAANVQLTRLVDGCRLLLTEEQPARLRSIVLNFLLSLISLTDDQDGNPFTAYVVDHFGLLEALLGLLASVSLRQEHGREVCLLIALLLQYKKFAASNFCRMQLSILNNELTLNGFSYVISLALADYNNKYREKTAEPQGLLSSLSSFVGNILVGEEKKVDRVNTQDGLLMALYEAVRVNRNFITTLTYAHTPSAPPTPAPGSDAPPAFPTPPSPPLGAANAPTGGASPPPTTPPMRQLSDASSGAGEAPSSPGAGPAAATPPAGAAGEQGPGASPPAALTAEPANLLAVFLEYCSIVVQDTRDVSRCNSAKLCFLILMCVTEDQYGNSLMHDSNMNFRVTLHRAPMRHRKIHHDKIPMSQPLAVAVLDLMVEFLQSHLMKAFPSDLYSCCLGIIHRMLCYQRKCRVRLSYSWNGLWAALFNLVRFLLSIEQHFSQPSDLINLFTKIITVFNIFITYGDAFLVSATTYDELYYEIIRMHSVFDDLHCLVLRYATKLESMKEKLNRLSSQLINIKSIINHFTPKVDAWAHTNNHTSITQEQVLQVIKQNYDTLTLKLQDCLDNYERYDEACEKEIAFFNTLVRSIMSRLRDETLKTSSELQNYYGELSTIT